MLILSHLPKVVDLTTLNSGHIAIAGAAQADKIDASCQSAISRRLEEVDSGQVKAIPWEEARLRLRGRSNGLG